MPTPPNLNALGQLLADAIVHFAVGNDPTTQSSRAQLLMNIAGSFIATNSGDLATAASDFATITANIQDPALKDMALTALTTVANFVAGIRNLSAFTLLGTSVTTLLNSMWTQISFTASKYVLTPPPAPPAA